MDYLFILFYLLNFYQQNYTNVTKIIENNKEC